ncbi:MAG TPA: zf-HC2 domain-containing protein [Aliidongia sp.]|uniref:anti-sigma factor family protein n=1 Tax=Aliidongia sp. TaxID=1914230 RepID=UPI002DDDABE2|nr:zf-HC2 domain-containing protein [Aliidongia sp.]HEV2676072.1 zf-HC2 domain-containing protein [Aliidongia sp.]
MTTDDCAEVTFLLQADFDGELDVGGSARVAAHVANCADCAAKQAALGDLSGRLGTEASYHAAPDRLRRSIETALAASRTAAPPAPIPLARPAAASRVRAAGGWRARALPFGAGAAMAAVLALAMILPRGGDLTDSVVSSHIRALQPGHLMDVVSTDQHTVKPWFDGRLDYAPPVKDLASQGFPLIGGRLDYLAGRPVAALAYRRAQHVVDLYVWPSSSTIESPPGSGEHSGYNYLRWTQDEMVFWAVSDLNKTELGEFADRWRASP